MDHPERHPRQDADTAQSDNADSAQSHYFTPRTPARSRPSTVRLDLPGVSLDLVVDRGVFSPDRIDPGTKLLLMELPPLPRGPVLDLGCGYGPIATTLAVTRPGEPLWAIDVSERARDLCSRNLGRHAPPGTPWSVVAPDAVPSDLRFAAVVSNPPIRVGKAALHDMLRTWLARLAPGGEAWLVVHRHLGADSLAAWLTARSHGVERIRSRQGYRVLRVTNPD